MAKLKLAAPWYVFYEEMKAMFERDPYVHVFLNEDENSLKLYVTNDEKAYALSQVLPDEKEFGNVKMPIYIVPANGKDIKELSFCNYPNVNPWETVFMYNDAVDDIKPVEWIGGQVFNYIVFKKEVVQYYTDNLGDLNGMASTLYETIAKDIFINTEGTFFCTNTELPKEYYFG